MEPEHFKGIFDNIRHFSRLITDLHQYIIVIFNTFFCDFGHSHAEVQKALQQTGYFYYLVGRRLPIESCFSKISSTPPALKAALLSIFWLARE
jgi:hypothetical protein